MLTVDVFCRFSCKASGVTFTILGQELSIYGSQPDFMDWHSVSKLHLKKDKNIESIHNIFFIIISTHTSGGTELYNMAICNRSISLSIISRWSVNFFAMFLRRLLGSRPLTSTLVYYKNLS